MDRNPDHPQNVMVCSLDWSTPLVKSSMQIRSLLTDKQIEKLKNNQANKHDQNITSFGGRNIG